MRQTSIAAILFASLACVCVAALVSSSQAHKPDASGPKAFAPQIPRAWNDQDMSTLELPLANPANSPRQVAADYYYQIPVRPIYKSYPVYVPGHEPPDHQLPAYMDWLKQQEPELLWGIDPKTGVEHKPSLKTEADWIKAGEMVFDSAIIFTPPPPLERVIQLYNDGRPVPSSGVDPFVVWVIRQEGKVEAAFGGCADCHTRVMPDGTLVKGGQGNNPIDHGIAFSMRVRLAAAQNTQALVGFIRLGERSQFEVPWLESFEQPDYAAMSVEEIAATHAAIPAGVLARQGTSVLSPAHIPDLIGVKERHYLDATGLQQQRSIVDLMRYAALNQGADSLANYNGFVPTDIPDFKKLPAPDKLSGIPPASQGRYSDEQLYALALYIYSLQPPPNPNKLDAVAESGQKVFERERCATCHTPPLYTNNKLTPAAGFTPPPGAEKKYEILRISVGTDSKLALKTRRGTGYYKVPSLRGVWYRSMFGHSGWCATIEDWFDPRRTRDDYIPTGFKPYGAKTYAVKGHPFGLNLSEEDRKALIAFLKTL